jgi:hypothetical protein
MALILPGSPESDDIDAGFRYISEQLHQQKPAFFLGRGPEGFALLVGSPKRFDIAGGVAIGVALAPAHMAALRDRVMCLLHGEKLARRIERGV